MPQNSYQVGDMVVLSTQDWGDHSAVVCAPVGPDREGQVLFLLDGCIQGVSVSPTDLAPADKAAGGFAQLAASLIKLGSHVIEKRIIKLV